MAIGRRGLALALGAGVVFWLGAVGCSSSEDKASSNDDAGVAPDCSADGVCEEACQADPDCTEGGDAAATSCDEGDKLCDGECVALDRSETGCSSSDCSPCQIANAQTTCDSFRSCAIAACDSGYADCNDTSADGCETNITSDPEHCGACDEACDSVEHGSGTCASAQCVILTCDVGWADCDMQLGNGCETDAANDEAHCGACDEICPDGQICEDGACSGASANPCEAAISASCQAEFNACTGDCATEFECTQGCIIDVIIQDGFVTGPDQATCAASCAVDLIVTAEMNSLFNCLTCDENAAVECLGEYDPPLACP